MVQSITRCPARNGTSVRAVLKLRRPAAEELYVGDELSTLQKR